MDELVGQLKALFAHEFHGSEFIPEEVPPRIAGILIWPGFAQKPTADRQRKVSQAIRQLNEEQQRGVSIIMTYTPEEYEAIIQMNASADNS
jgi:hypothetical protein